LSRVLASPITRDISGIKTEIFIAGEGRNVLFLHPGDGIEASGPFLDLLARNHRVIAPSHPGFGGTELPDWMDSVDDLAYFHLDLMDALDLDDVILVGVSFGGWVAAEIAVKASPRVSGLVLVGATGAKFSGPETREITDIFEVPPYELGRLFFNDDGRWDLGYGGLSEDQLLRLARNRQSLGRFAWSPTLFSHKLRHRLHRISVPAVLAWGEKDKVVSQDYGRRFAEAIPGSNFVVFENAGHYAHLEQPERVAAAIERLAA